MANFVVGAKNHHGPQVIYVKLEDSINFFALFRWRIVHNSKE